MNDAARYTGLLVDWGGVMTTNVFDSFRAFCERRAWRPRPIGERFRSDPASRDLLIGLETGTLPETGVRAAVRRDPGRRPRAGLIERLFAGGRPDEAMHDAVRRARAAGIRTGLISNSWGTSRYDRALLAELFDGVVISGEVGIRKPAPEIYAMGARAIDLPPAACVFVDDLPFNLAPARDLGMATVRHVSPRQTIEELERAAGGGPAVTARRRACGRDRGGVALVARPAAAGSPSLSARQLRTRRSRVCTVATAAPQPHPDAAGAHRGRGVPAPRHRGAQARGGSAGGVCIPAGDMAGDLPPGPNRHRARSWRRCSRRSRV